MASEDKFVQPGIPRFDGHYGHCSMLMENFLRFLLYLSELHREVMHKRSQQIMMPS
ncbi:unnamed protein product [Rhodiola kirilowii]